jgi:predicted nuclease of predicted toxin-antitoxin system
MRVLANENIPGPVVRTLRELGHDVLWAKENLRGEADHVVLSRAQTEQRVTVTCDPVLASSRSMPVSPLRAESSCFVSSGQTLSPTTPSWSPR